MTDKQIIIDGVDVSGCKNFYAKTKDCVQEDTIDTPCVDHPNCYYKQLKRKEQECEELEKQKNILLGQLVINDGEDVTVQISQGQFEKYNQLLEQLEAYKMEAEEGKEININAELKADNYYLKRKISYYENLLKLDFTKSTTAEEVVQHANYLIEQGRILLIEENQKLKQTLTEIKEIVGVGLVDGLQPEEYSGFLKILQAQILQKISEVEDA